MTAPRIVASPKALVRRFGDEVLLAAADGDEIHRLTGTAAIVWDALAEPTSVDAVVARLAETHDEPVERIAGDISSFAEQLIEQGWVVVVGGTG